MDESQISALRRVQAGLAAELMRSEANALLKAGLVQRFGGLLKVTAKGKAILANSSPSQT